MANFTISTTDSKYTYTSRNNTPATVSQKLVNNNSKSNTQGFLRKVQVGRYRAEMSVSVDDSKTNIETNLLPMLTYPVSVTVTIDRNILGRNSKSAEFVIEDYDIPDELGGSDDDNADMIVMLKLIEVIDSTS